jgi:2-haloacid dehalogenase
MSQIPQAVVFDVGRVLFEWDLRHLYAKLIADPEELDWFLAHVVTVDWHFRHDAGHPLEKSVPELKARFPDHAELIDVYVPRFSETLPWAVPGSVELVERLAQRGVPLFALTNFGAEFFAHFREAQAVFARFRDIVVSGDEKCVKPEPRIYEIAERRFGYPAEALFFTDDNPDHIAAAAARGWQTHLFVDAAGLEADLIARGLLESA